MNEFDVNGDIVEKVEENDNSGEFYSLEAIKKLNCQYNLIFGKRSNGKTYAVLYEGFLHQYITAVFLVA